MFEKLQNLFAGSEAQSARTQQQFVEHWCCVKDNLKNTSGSLNIDVYDSKAASHIAEMIYMIENDKAPPESDYGPCVEFILQNDVLGALQKHAQNDIPVGIRKIVLTFLSQLIQKLPRSALPHLHIHRPLQDMLCICGSGKYPIDEINFITSILGKFHEDPSLVNLFMNETLGRNGSKSYELRLLDALISLSHLKDDRVVKKSCESLLLCVAADSEYVIDNILSYTILVQDLVSRLCQRYGCLRVEPSVLLYTNVSWTSQLEHTIAEHTDSSAIRLLLWVDFLNTLAKSAHPNFANKLLKHLSKVFFYTHLLHDFECKDTRMVTVKAIVICLKMLKISTSELLLVELLKFLTDDKVVTVLCSLLSCEEPSVVESTLHLFNEMFETRHSLVVETLVLRYTKKNVDVRTKLLLTTESSTLQRSASCDSGVDEETCSDEETSFIHMNTACFSYFEPDSESPSLLRRVIQTEGSTSSANEDSDNNFAQCSSTPENNFAAASSPSPDDQHPSSSTETLSAVEVDRITLEHNRVGSPNHFKTVIVSHDHVEDVRKPGKGKKNTLKLDHAVHDFLEVMPALSQPRMVGFSEYLHDAHVKAKEVSAGYSWISTQKTEVDVTNDCGIFLRKVIEMVPSIPYQSYEVNMYLMALISEICYIPHTSVTIYLLDTSLPPSPPLFKHLKDVAEQFTDIFEASPTLKEQLLSLDDDMSDVCKAATLSEEFCKELAAITLVKSTTC